MSLQDQLEKLGQELQEVHAQKKRLEEEHSSEKLGLTQVSRFHWVPEPGLLWSTNPGL